LAHGFEQFEGEFIVIVVAHEPLIAVIVKLVPTEIPVTLFVPFVPALTTIVAPVDSTKLTSHVVPLQIPLPAVNCGVTQEEGQSTFGVDTETELVHPAPLEAVRVTVLFFKIPVTEFPLTVPSEAITPFVAFVKKFNVYVEPLQFTLPAVIEGFVQEGHVLEDTVNLVVSLHPDNVAEITTLVPLGILITLSPETVPAEAVTFTLLFNFKKLTE
jgi:hypothetical protein